MKFFRSVVAIAVGLMFMGAGCSGASSVAISTDAQSSPQKVVEAFYATYMQDRNAALTLVDADAQKTDKFQRNWEKIKDWTFTKVEIVSVKEPYVEVKFTITIDGEDDSGTDDVTVKLIDEKWWITEIPS